MSSSNYIPLAQLSDDHFLYSPRPFPPSRSLFSHFSRRRAVLALVATSSLLTLLLFLKISLAHDDDLYDVDIPINPDFQPAYIALPVPDALPASTHPTLRPVRDLPTHCLDQFYTAAHVCHDDHAIIIPLDVVWTWVNGSDPLFLEGRAHATSSYAENDPYRPIKSNNPSRMFRDHDELRHSVRSVLDNFRPYTKRFHILTSDFDYPHEGAEESIHSFPDPGPGYWRLGLQPQWLDSADKSVTEWRDGDVQLSLKHHAHFFEPYNKTIYNSYAIESQFIHIQDLSDVFVYMNDDFYMTTPLTPVTFYTEPYGVVLRMQHNLLVSPDWPVGRLKGEWRSMGVSNWLMSKRFGRRGRPYVVHEAKTVSLPIIQELALMWPDAVVNTATHAFRETVSGDGDYYQMFMFAHYLVERSRETLLWMWIVGRVGGIDDSWGEREAERAWIELGGTWDGETSKEIKVESGLRETLQKDRVYRHLKESGYTGKFKTEYQFSSLDGFAYNPYGRRASSGWPGFEPEQTDFGTGPAAVKQQKAQEQDRLRRICTVKRDECFSVNGPDDGPPGASDIFKHIAFDRIECGDCILIALTNASGPLGLSAFLPHPDRRTPSDGEMSNDGGSSIPHLPLVDDWHDGQFAIRDVMKYAPDTSVREWSMRILQRYRYVIGETPSKFEQLLNLQQVRGMLAAVDKTEDLALLCINDDVTREDAEVSKLFRKWQDKRWSRPAAWESDVHHRRRTLNEPFQDSSDSLVP